MESSEITKLALLLKQHGDKILNGNHQLALTATLLQYLNNAFCMVVEHDENSSFQVIHTTNSKLHYLHFLHDFVQKVEGLIISHGASTLKGNVDISKFRNLRYLELQRVPLHMVTGLPSIQHHLKCVIASQSLSRPSDLLGGEGEPLPANAWPQLCKLSLSQNTLNALDSSLKLATSLKEVDLSHNQLCDVPELGYLSNLTVLNLSYNRLQAVPKFHHLSSRTLKALAMAHNQLESLSGLEMLNSLQILHAGWNCLLDSSSLAPLSRLSSLHQLWLDGNPMSRHAHYRERTAKHLHPCVSSISQFKLNGTVLNEQEKRWVGAACLGLSASLLATNRDTGSQKVQQQPQQQGGSKSETRRGVKVREAVIADLEESTTAAIDISFSSESVPSLDLCTEHLETKRQIESLREKLGDNWLVGVPSALGLPESTQPVASSSYQCHEAQAWLDSQQRPPQINSNQSISSAVQQDSQSAAIENECVTNQSPMDNVVTIHSETFVEHSDTENTSFDTENASSEFESSTQSEPIVESQDDDEKDEEGSEPPFLVQRKLFDNVSRDYFFIIGPSMLLEREVGGKCKIVTQWTVDSLQSCEHPAFCQVILTFDTIRRDKQRREYTLDASEVQRLCSSLGSRLESRSLRDMNQVQFHCMKCSTKFSAEITETPARCPSCSSAVVVQDDPEWSTATQPPHQQQLIHSDSQSSIGASCIPTASMVLVAAEVHPCAATAAAATNNMFRTASKKSSAASLDQSMSDSGLGLTGGRSRFTEGADSDIEVLSNPSQSSIEILPIADDNHSREQSVAPASTLSEASQAKSPYGLTESSSSGSMTDSVCTAYESGNPNITTSQPSSSLSGVVGSFFQRFVALSSSPTGKDASQPMLYNFSDFARIDHRLKLYLCMHVLNHENELLTALLRCWVLPSSTANGIPFSGLLIISSQALYIMKIKGAEGENPERWLVNEGVWPLSQVLNICMRMWHHAVEVAIQFSNNKTQKYTLILGDRRHAAGFVSFIAGLMPATCQVQRLDSTGDYVDEPMQLIGSEQAVFFAIVSNFLPSDKTGSQQAYGPIALAVSNAEVALSKEDLRFVPEQNWSDFWAFRKPITSLMGMETSSSAPWMLRLHFTEETGESSQNLNMSQINEKRNSQGFVEEEWTLWFVSQQSRLGVIEALRCPWQKFFEVPLDVRLV